MTGTVPQRLTTLETYNATLIVRAATPILLVGRCAQDCLMAIGVYVVGSRTRPVALLGVPMVFAGKLPALTSQEHATQALGHDWYLVDETECREAFGDAGLPATEPEAGLWPAPRFDDAPRPVNYFEDPD